VRDGRSSQATGPIIVDPTLESVAVLGIIVVIRILLSFSLEVEIDGVWPWSRRQLGSGAPEPSDDPEVDRGRKPGVGAAARFEARPIRLLNCALHRLAVNNGLLDPETAAGLARKRDDDGKSRREALRVPQAPPRPPRLAPPAMAALNATVARPNAPTSDHDDPPQTRPTAASP